MAQASSHQLTFRLSCWLLAIMAFAQLMTAAIALAMRLELAKASPRTEPIAINLPKVAINEPLIAPIAPLIADTKELPTPAPAPVPQTIVEKVNPAPLPQPKSLSMPEIGDPITEKLWKEAKTARLAEDMMTAITKLEQALQQSPKQPQVLFELGLCHEDMGIYDRAKQYYHQVFQLGTTTAGQLYVQAAEKLKSGFEQPQDKINRLVLGRIRVFQDSARKEGEKIVLTIPIQCPPSEKIEGRDLEVRVNFFEEWGAQKEVQPADTSLGRVEYQWTTEPLDWSTGEELLQVTYTPQAPDAQQAHLFGQKKYHGQVVELTYKGQLIDAQAWPRILAHRLNRPDSSPMFLEGELPADFNAENPLLPNASEASLPHTNSESAMSENGHRSDTAGLPPLPAQP
jgi:hypothetical protein